MTCPQTRSIELDRANALAPKFYELGHPIVGQLHDKAGQLGVLATNDKGDFWLILYACHVVPFPHDITLIKD